MSQHTTNSVNRGIDYGLGTTNIDQANGIRYGVCSQHFVSPDVVGEFDPIYESPCCPRCGVEVQDFTHAPMTGKLAGDIGKDYYCEGCEATYWSDECYGDEPFQWRYEQDGYLVELHQDGDLFVLKSPYWTRAQFCSPCAPGACHLENATPAGERCYALGHDFFDDGRAPYPIYTVDGNHVVGDREVKS